MRRVVVTLTMLTMTPWWLIRALVLSSVGVLMIVCGAIRREYKKVDK